MSVMEDLARELGMDPATVKQSVYFFQTYLNRSPRATNLTWAHYRKLIAVKDDSVRQWYERAAERMGWTRDQLVSAIKRRAYDERGRNGKLKARSKLKRPTQPTFVYKALVERVVDGDTLLLRIDLGFQVWKEQRIRLAQIDTAPIDTKKGRDAFEYVRNQLAKSEFVMVKTNKIDIYGRYVGDVFYDFGEAKRDKVFLEGRYLNQELLTRGLARRV